MIYTIYTDGACSPNPGKGGWGAIILNEKNERINLSEGELNSTNQRMELIAAIKSLQHIDTFCNVFDTIKLYTDSAYLCNCFLQKWYINWERNGWVNSKKQPVANQDLWEDLIILFNKFQNLSIIKVKGHSGDILNEEVDKLAVAARLSL